MSNLSKETTDIIEQQAKDYAQKRCDDFEGKKHLHRKTLLMYAHQAGATEWAGKAQDILIPAINELRMRLYVCKDTGKPLDNDNAILLLETALAKYKEVSND